MKRQKNASKAQTKTSTFNRYHARFVTAARAHHSAEAKLSQVGYAAIEGGATRQVLVEWLIEADYSKSHANDVAGKLWHEVHGSKSSGKRGKKRDPRAVELYRYAVRKYGKDAKGLLLAAWKEAKATK